MKLERIVLENVCQHQHLEHVWHRGLNGILGPNGSGKSNVIKAISYALTGNFDNAGIKAENVCQLAGEKARSRVTLSFEHDGISVEVIRVLRRGTSSCRIDSGEQIDGDMAVTEAVMDVLGVDYRILSEYIFVPQRRMAGFVDETPGERNKTFGQLFDLSRAETIYKMLDAEVRRVGPAPRSPEIDPLRERVVRNRARRDELVAAGAAQRNAIVAFNNIRAKELIDHADRWDESSKALDANAGLFAKLEAELEARRGELKVADAERADLVWARSEAAGDLEAARKALAGWEVIRARRERRDALQARQEALDAEPAAHPEPPPPKDYLGDEATSGRLAELSHHIRFRKELLEKFKNAPRVCPTCGTETDAILEKAARYKKELPGLERELAEITQSRAAANRWVREYERWHFWAQAHKQRQAELAGEWKAIEEGVEETASVDPGVCHEVVDAGALLETAIAEAGARAVQLRQEVERCAGRVDEAGLLIIRLRRALGVRPDPAVVEEARAGLAHYEQVCRDASRCEGELSAVARALADDETMLERLEAAEAKAELDRLWVYHLGEIRKIMHHDQLPKVVAHNYLEILADDTNELLESFDADFRVSLGDGLNFVATFLRGPYAGAVSPAQRLSEGQKVLLALAFRVAVNSLFAGTAGLLCLDEPTESLDERNLACLEVAIGKMRDLSESRGLQCLLVTHEPSFEVLFDGVLRLAA